MRLQKVLNVIVKGKRYYKHQINIPAKSVEDLGWKEGEKLGAKIEGESLTLYKID